MLINPANRSSVTQFQKKVILACRNKQLQNAHWLLFSCFDVVTRRYIHLALQHFLHVLAETSLSL